MWIGSACNIGGTGEDAKACRASALEAPTIRGANSKAKLPNVMRAMLTRRGILI